LAVSDIALKEELPREISKSLAAYVGCVAGAIRIDDYRQGLLAAGFEHVEIVDSGADLNAYAKAENQSVCCSPAMGKVNPFEIVGGSCCSSTPEPNAAFHDELKTLLSQFDINRAAASVKVFAVMPSTAKAA
jgi:arsenite methyltransferase